MSFKEYLYDINESSKIIFRGSKEKVSKVMNALQDYEEKHDYPYQGYSSYTLNYTNYVIEVDDISSYQKHKVWMDKIINKF